MPKRIGIFGGAFDPIHLGHLTLAETALKQANLDIVIFIPCKIPVHKAATHAATIERVTMCRLAIADQPAFSLHTCEVNRESPSYMINTLRILQGEHPDAAWFLIVGQDAAATLPTWHEAEALLSQVTVLVGGREDSAEISSDYVSLDMPVVNVSSTEVRKSLKTGASVEPVLPAVVKSHIDEHKLYQ